MNKVILATALVLICISLGYSQTAQTQSQTSASGEATAAARAAGKTVNIASGTRLTGELQNTINVRKAKVGDEVVLKTTQAIKSEGRTVVKKGARLIGHITEVSAKTKADSESRVAILFDRLESGSLEVAIAATITSLSKARADALTNNQAAAGINAGSSSSASGSPIAGGRTSSSAGLVGGVTNSVGGAVNATSAATGDVLNTTAATVGSAVSGSTNTAGGVTSAVGSSLGRIQITESADASASGGSVLSLRGENLRIEKGTSFNLVLTQKASAETSP